MDLIFDQNDIITFIDVAIVTPFSSPALIAAASTRPGHMAKRAGKIKFDPDPGDYRPPWISRQEVHQQPHETCRQPFPRHPRHVVSRPERTSQRHLQITTHSSSHVTLCPSVLSPYSHACTSFRILQPLKESVCHPSLCLHDHSSRISGAPLIKSGTRGGLLHGHSTPRWLSPLGADRQTQPFHWPTAARQSWSQSPSAAADSTAPMNVGAQLQDIHCSVQDVFTQSSWTILPRRRIRS